MNSSDVQSKKILEDKLKDVEKNIKTLEDRLGKAKRVCSSIEIELAGLKNEREELKEAIDIHSKRLDIFSDRKDSVISALDSLHELKEEKKGDLQVKIDELKDKQRTVSSNYAKKKIGKQINRLEDKIKKLQKSQVRYEKIQRRIMLPKYKKLLKETKKESFAKGRVDYYEQLIRDNSAIRDAIDPSSRFSAIQKNRYDRKEKKYLRKRERAEDVYQQIIDNSGCLMRMRGARITSFAKRQIDKIRAFRDAYHDALDARRAARTTPPTTPTPRTP